MLIYYVFFLRCRRTPRSTRADTIFPYKSLFRSRDRASIRLAPTDNVALEFGRFANPLWTSDLVFDNDMNFDGVAISGQGAVANGVRLFGTLGAFPVFNTDLNFGTRNAPTIIDPETGDEIGTGRPFKSEDRYLLDRKSTRLNSSH